MAVTGVAGAISTVTLNSALYQTEFDKKLYDLYPKGSVEYIVNRFPMDTIYQDHWTHAEDNSRFRKDDSLAAQFASGDTDATVTTGTKFVEGDVWLLNDGTNTEWIRVSGAISGSTVPFLRDFDGGGAHTFASGTRMILIAPALGDGGDRPTAVATEPDRVTNYVQKMRVSFELTSWQQIAKMYTGSEQDRLDNLKFMEYNEFIAKTGFYGVSFSGMINGELTQMTAGILSQISTNNIVIGTTAGFTGNTLISEAELRAALEIAGSGPTGITRYMAIARWAWMQWNGFAWIQQMTQPGGDKYGFNLKELVADVTYKLLPTNMLEHFGATNRYSLYGSHAVIIPEGFARWKGLGDEGKHNMTLTNHKGGDAGSHKITGEHWCSKGLDIEQESLWATISGFTGTE